MGRSAMVQDNNEVFIGRDMGHMQNYSEKIAAEIDEEIQKIVGRGYQKTEAAVKRAHG